MISVSKLRSGIVFEYKDEPWRVVEYKHVHLSRGAGTITIRARNLKKGTLKKITFKSGEKVAESEVQRNNYSYLYRDGENMIFMEPASFVQFAIPKRQIGESARYLVEGQEVAVMFWKGEAINIDIPLKVKLKVSEASPGVKGDSVSSATKEVVLENGMQIRAPLFIKRGDTVIVDIRDGEYVERES